MTRPAEDPTESPRILFISNYFPPEVNAPATRTAEHTRIWSGGGTDVQVLTSAPNFPEGAVFDGFENRLTRDRDGGVEVLRVPMYISPNRGTVRRTLSYLSFMVSAAWHGPRRLRRPDVVVATSPQFFAAFAGWWVARAFRVPFVLEVRDLWPDSIVAVGAFEESLLIRFFRRLERWVYDKAHHIVVVTDSFVGDLEAKGIPSEKISVVKNGVDLEAFPIELLDSRDEVREKLGLSDRFVASYIGTLGMAHRADIILDAAELAAASDDPEDRRLAFLLVGTGAQREEIEARLAEAGLDNVVLLDKQPRAEALALLAASDVSLVHLRAAELFQTVIPSKIFEAMAFGRPIVLGVDGEARRIVEGAGAGRFAPPENPTEMLAAVRSLRDDASLWSDMSEAGRRLVATSYDRRQLAERYVAILQGVAARGRRPT